MSVSKITPLCLDGKTRKDIYHGTGLSTEAKNTTTTTTTTTITTTRSPALLVSSKATSRKSSQKQYVQKRQHSGRRREGRLFGNVNIQEFETQDTKMKRNRQSKIRADFLLHPHGTVRLFWDSCLLLALAHVAVMLPLEIGYTLQQEGPLHVLDIAIDIFFCVDVCLNFRTSFIRDDGVEETRWKEIAKAYLCGFFIVDLISSVPLDRILANEEALENLKAAKGLKAGKILKISRMLKIAKLLRLVRVKSIFARFKDYWILGRNTTKILRLLIFSCFCAHINACGFSFVSRFSDDFYVLSWQREYADGYLTLRERHFTHEYIVALNWAVCTMTSVGYGDVVAQNDLERCFTLYMMFFSCIFYAFILGSMASLVASLDVHSKQYQSRMDNIASYTRLRNFPRQLSRRILAYYRHFYERKTALDEGRILHDLSASLRSEVWTFLVDSIFANIEIFRGLPTDIQTRLFTALRPERFEETQKIHACGESATEMYVVTKGSVAVFAAESIELNRLSSGSCFGEIYAFGLADYWDVETRAMTKYVELYSLGSSAINDIFKYNPTAYEEVRDMIIGSCFQRLNDLKDKIRNATFRAYGGAGAPVESQTERRANQIRLERLELLCSGLRPQFGPNDRGLYLSEHCDEEHCSNIPNRSSSVYGTRSSALKREKSIFSPARQRRATSGERRETTADFDRLHALLGSRIGALERNIIRAVRERNSGAIYSGEI